MLALDRIPHQLIRRKDIIPTPSHPMKSWYMLLAVTMMIMATRNKIRYLMNLLILGSEAIYQIENSVIDHVINRAIVINTREMESRVKEMSKFSV